MRIENSSRLQLCEWWCVSYHCRNSVSPTQIRCVTNQHKKSERATCNVRVELAGNGKAVQVGNFQYLQKQFSVSLHIKVIIFYSYNNKSFYLIIRKSEEILYINDVRLIHVAI